MPARKYSRSRGSCRAESARQSPGDFKFEFTAHRNNIPETELLDDLRRIARKLRKKTLTKKAYTSQSQFGDTVFVRRFGSWQSALKKAGLVPSRNFKVSVEALFENLEQVWLTLGRQPVRVDMQRPLSKISPTPYITRFGGFQNAMRAFVEWKARHPTRKSSISTPSPHQRKTHLNRHKTGRKVNLRLRFLVFQRDNFKCRACGRSPANEQGVKLHVYHKIPWSAGGETVAENLQTLCQKCNLGKSNQ